MLKQHLTTAFVHIRRSPYQAISATLVMTLTFFAATVFAILAYVSTVTLHYFETTPQVITFLKNEATPEEISALSKKLANDPRIKSNIRFVSHEEAFKIFKETADNPLSTELVSPDVLPASLEFSLADLAFTQEVIAEVKKDPIVQGVEFTAAIGGENTLSQVVEDLQKITKNVRLGGGAILSFLGIMAILNLLVIIGTRIASRREEINVLTLIGATPGFIRLPFLLEGIIYALSGVILGFLVAVLLFLYLMPALSSFFGEVPAFPREISIILVRLGILLAIEVLAGLMIGLVGAWFAIARYLKI